MSGEWVGRWESPVDRICASGRWHIIRYLHHIHRENQVAGSPVGLGPPTAERCHSSFRCGRASPFIYSYSAGVLEIVVAAGRGTV